MAQNPAIDRPDFHLRLVHDISQLINQSQGLDSILQRTVAHLAASLGFDVVSIYLYDPRRDVLVLRATHGLSVPAGREITLEPHEGLTGLTFRDHRALSTTPASQHPAYKFIPGIGEEEYDSYLGVPIMLSGRCLGVLIGQTRQARTLNPAEEALFEVIASRLAGLLEVTDRLDRLRPPDEVQGRALQALQGKGISGGFAVGPAYIVQRVAELSADSLPVLGRQEELDRLRTALQAACDELRAFLARMEGHLDVPREGKEIFRSHLMLLEDPVFHRTLTEAIEAHGLAAETAVAQEIAAIAGQFDAHEEEHFRQRGQDFRDIGQRLLEHLLRLRNGQSPATCGPPAQAVLVAEEIGPSLLVTIGREGVAAFITEKGGETSHVAILARSLGIPAVAGVQGACQAVRSGQQLLVDGRTGFIFANPSADLVREYAATRDRQAEMLERLRRQTRRGEEASGIQLALSASIGYPDDVAAALQHGLREVGLFRTEFTFMLRDDWPSANVQREVYEEVGRHFDQVTIRTLDIGGDKVLSYFHFPREDNPLLGLRSIRFSMEYLDLFREQVRAILLAGAAGPRFRILLPLVTNLWEVETAREILHEIAHELGIPPQHLPAMGIMVEVPATVWQLDDFAGLVDFISIGTNDLVQYLLAVDRNSHLVGHLYSGEHPAVLRALRHIADFAARTDTEVTVCGELAGEPLGALGLLALGFRRFSVLPARALLLRHLAQHVDGAYLQAIAADLLVQRNERDARRLLSEALWQIDPAVAEAAGVL